MAKVKSGKKLAKETSPAASGSTSKDEAESGTMWQKVGTSSPSHSYESAGSYYIVDTGASAKTIASSKQGARKAKAERSEDESSRSAAEAKLLHQIMAQQKKAEGRAYQKWWNYHCSNGQKPSPSQLQGGEESGPRPYDENNEPYLAPFFEIYDILSTAL